MQHPIASTLISRAYAAASRRAALGVYDSSGDVGKMVVGAAAIELGIVAIGWRSSVVLYGLIVVAVGLLTLVALARFVGAAPPKRGCRRAGIRAGLGVHRSHGLRTARRHPAHRQCLPHGVPHLLPVPADRQRASVASIGFGLSLVFVGGAAGKLVCGLIAERVGILRTVIVSRAGRPAPSSPPWCSRR